MQNHKHFRMKNNNNYYLSIKSISHCISNLNYKIRIDFDFSEGLRPFFKAKYFEYTIEKINGVEKIADEIVIIPFVCNILPLIWLTDADLRLSKLDKAFFYSIPHIKAGYSDMYPELHFKGNIEVEELCEWEQSSTNKNALLFSGGIDAWCSLLRHEEENLDLITLHGSLDFPLGNNSSWNIQKSILQNGAEVMGKNLFIISTNFTEILDLWGEALTKLISVKRNLTWWHDMQHGIGIIGHVAVLSALYNYNTVYIASTYHISQNNVTCASDPTIDNKVKFLSSKVFHDGYELTRQEKTKYICDKIKDRKIEIHVCLIPNQKHNCCRCEKCLRTIFSIYAEGGNPNNLGFNYSHKDIKGMLKYLNRHVYLHEYNTVYWKDIQQRIIQNKDLLSNKLLNNYFTKQFNIKKHNKLWIKKIIRSIERIRKYL